MNLDRAQLAAFAAILASGSFDQAAQRLGITQSAVSQRLKALEERLGCILVIRGQPCTASDPGRRLLQHAQEVALLERQLGEEIGLSGDSSVFASVSIAVNADSLATWFVDAMAQSGDFLFDLKLDDQDYSAEWLRRGEVRAAVSAESAPVQGCDVFSLGGMIYRATATPEFAERWFANGVSLESLSRAPAITFNTKDNLLPLWSRQVFGESIAPQTHWIASSDGFVHACLAHLGWGLNPDALVAEHIATGRLVDLVPEGGFKVPLYWHISRSVRDAMAPVSAAVRSVAQMALVQTN